MIAPFIIIAGCSVVFVLFVAVTWSYDRGFIDGRDSASPEPDLPPLGENPSWVRADAEIPTP